MRFFLLLITVALVPLLVMLHAQFFMERQAPELQSRLLAVLQARGIESASVELDLLDAKISGVAQNLEMAEKAHAAARELPVRIVEDRIYIPARVQGTLSGEELILSGWLPEKRRITEITDLLHHLRPDLRVNVRDLHTDARVQKLSDEKITAQSFLLNHWLDNLRQPVWLKVKRDAQGLHVNGLLPTEGGIKAAIVKALDLKDAETLRESLHTQSAAFLKPVVLANLLKSVFLQPVYRELTFAANGSVHIQAATTRVQAVEWQRLLQALSGKETPTFDLTYYVSDWHLPYRALTSPLSAEQGRTLSTLLTQDCIVFPPGSADLTAPQQSQLASLAPHLVAAGPAVRLALVTYAEKGGAETRDLGFQRLETVHTFLIEQGLSARDVEKVVLEDISPGTSGKPTVPGTVEILLR